MRNKKYWKERFRQLEASQHHSSEKLVEEVRQQMRRAEAEITRKINAWYGRLAANNGISMAEAKKLLNRKELEEFRWDVNDYIKYGKENAINGQWMKQLENASARVHISRLEQLKLQVQQEAERLYGNYLDGVDRHIKTLYEEGFYKTAYEIQKGIGVGWNLTGVDSNRLDKIIRKPWAADGKNFSERIWSSKQQLVENVHTSLTQMCILGQSPDKAIASLAHAMHTSKNQAGRLIMTESAFFGSESRKDCLNELGVEQYEIVATLDAITSDICQEMDGKVFPMSEYESGSTAPPFHVWCRTTTVPIFGDEFDHIGERAARDLETGKTYYVPADMKYQEWKESFADGGDKSGLQEAKADDTMKKGKVSEMQTFEEMQQYMKQNYNIEILGSVSTLDFQSVKEGVSGIEHIIQEFPQAKSSFKTIGTENIGLMCSGYNGDISFNPGYYQTREGALIAHGIGEDIMPSGTHPKGNNCFGTGCHEAGHILEKALADKANGGECILSETNWRNSVFAEEVVSNACKEAKKLPECGGMTNKQLKDNISAYAGFESKYSEAETLAEAICDFALHKEMAQPLSKEIWKILKRELG